MRLTILLSAILLISITSCKNKNTSVEDRKAEVDSLYNEAVDLEDSLEYEAAVEKLTAVLKIDAKDIRALNNRAWDYYDLEEKELAMADFEKMLKIDPNSTAAMYGKAYLLFEQEKYVEALDYFNEIISIQGSLNKEEINRESKTPVIDAPLDVVFDLKAIAEEVSGVEPVPDSVLIPYEEEEVFEEVAVAEE